ncbi:MAG: hypothetical protein M3Q55_16635 [Acidobacteriota bacterium]|nr:hypothetical protein [Acidobacteriota bacterium]
MFAVKPARRIVTLAAAFAVFAPLVAAQAPSRQELTRALTSRFGMDDMQRAVLSAGLDSAEPLVSSASDGVAVIGGIWVAAPAAFYLEWAESFADFDRGSSVQAVRKLSNPPRLSDFDGMTLSKAELRDLSTCRVGDCALQLDAASINRIAALDWRRRDAPSLATGVIREMMFGIAARYAEIGDAGLPNYHDSKRTTDVAGMCASLLDEEASAGLAPSELLAYFAGRPGAPLPQSTSYLYWTTNSFGLKPTTRLNHTVVYRGTRNGTAGIVATKMLYATHYFHGGLEMRHVMADPAAPGRFLLVDVTRTRSDGLTGVTGAVIGDTVRRRGLESLRKYLRFTKYAVEQRYRLQGASGGTGGLQ